MVYIDKSKSEAGHIEMSIHGLTCEQLALIQCAIAAHSAMIGRAMSEVKNIFTETGNPDYIENWITDANYKSELQKLQNQIK